MDNPTPEQIRHHHQVEALIDLHKRLRQPVENQAEVDRQSAELLRATRTSTCPQCDVTIIGSLNRCPRCEGE